MLRASLSRSRGWLKLLLACMAFGGPVAAHAIDTYDPPSAILSIPFVIVGNTGYTNVQVSVGFNDVVTVGGVNAGNAVLDAADTFDGSLLTIAAVRVGNTIYSNVQVKVGLANVRAVGGATAKPTSGPWLTLANPLASAVVGQAYATSVVAAVWPTSQYTYRIGTAAGGALPSGMSIDLNGTLSGTPSGTGSTDANGYEIPNTYTFGVCATDTSTGVSSLPCPQTSITVSPASVTVAIVGSGAVSPSPGGNACGANCYSGYAQGATVTLTATPATGWTFTGWSGACAGTGACVLSASGTMTVTATFGQRASGQLVRADSTVTFGDLPTNVTTIAQCPTGMMAIAGGGLATAGTKEVFMSGSWPDTMVGGQLTGNWAVVWYPLSVGAGSASIATWATCTAALTDAVLVRANSILTFANPPTNQTATVQCPQNMKAIAGGGISVDGTEEIFINGSWPLNADANGSPTTDGWAAAWYPWSNGPGTASVDMWAVCSALLPNASIARADTTVNFAALPANETTIVQCPAGTKAISGGGMVTGGTIEEFMSGSWPDTMVGGKLTSSWATTWYPLSNGAGSANVSTWAICSP
jgi:hypothetical protein